MKRVVRVAVAEPSAIICGGLKSLLSGSDYEVVYVADDMRNLVECLPQVKADVVVVGSLLVATLQQGVRYAYPELQGVTLLMLSSTVCDDEIVRYFDAVINIYDSREQILRKIDGAIEQNQSNPYSDSHELSERERDVLVLVARGMTNKEIASELNISPHTVISHRKNIVHKTGIRSVAGLTVYAVLNKLIDSEQL